MSRTRKVPLRERTPNSPGRNASHSKKSKGRTKNNASPLARSATARPSRPMKQETKHTPRPRAEEMVSITPKRRGLDRSSYLNSPESLSRLTMTLGTRRSATARPSRVGDSKAQKPISKPKVPPLVGLSSLPRRETVAPSGSLTPSPRFRIVSLPSSPRITPQPSLTRQSRLLTSPMNWIRQRAHRLLENRSSFQTAVSPGDIARASTGMSFNTPRDSGRMISQTNNDFPKLGHSISRERISTPRNLTPRIHPLSITRDMRKSPKRSEKVEDVHSISANSPRPNVPTIPMKDATSSTSTIYSDSSKESDYASTHSLPLKASDCEFAENAFGENDVSDAWHSQVIPGSFYDWSDDSEGSYSSNSSICELNTTVDYSVDQDIFSNTTQDAPSRPSILESSGSSDEDPIEVAPRLSVCLPASKQSATPQRQNGSNTQPWRKSAPSRVPTLRRSCVGFDEDPIASDATELWMAAAQFGERPADLGRVSAAVLALRNGGGVDLSWIHDTPEEDWTREYSTLYDFVQSLECLTQRMSKLNSTSLISAVNSPAETPRESGVSSPFLISTRDSAKVGFPQPIDLRFTAILSSAESESGDELNESMRAIARCATRPSTPNVLRSSGAAVEEDTTHSNDQERFLLGVTSPRSALALFKNELCLRDLVPPSALPRVSFRASSSDSSHRSTSLLARCYRDSTETIESMRGSWQSIEGEASRREALSNVLRTYDLICARMSRAKLIATIRGVGSRKELSRLSHESQRVHQSTDGAELVRTTSNYLQFNTESNAPPLDIQISGGNSVERARIATLVRNLVQSESPWEDGSSQRRRRLRSPPPPHLSIGQEQPSLRSLLNSKLDWSDDEL